MTAFIDSNIPIYAAGSDRSFRIAARAVLAFGARHPGTMCSSAEVLQELLNLAIRRRYGASFAALFDSIEPATHGFIEAVNAADVVAASRLEVPGLSARDRVHAAVMQRIGVTQIISTDSGFDRIPTITRLDPLRFEEWRDSLLLEDGE